jgi:enoyl-CoA hydratase
VWQELGKAFDEFEKSDARVCVLRGAGKKAFVAGADISEFNHLDKAGIMQLSKAGQDTFFRIEKSLCSFKHKPMLFLDN